MWTLKVYLVEFGGGRSSDRSEPPPPWLRACHSCTATKMYASYCGTRIRQVYINHVIIITVRTWKIFRNWLFGFHMSTWNNLNS